MKRKTVTLAVSIGPGLFARTERLESLIEAYRRTQRECPHMRRDPQGTCYRCGQKGESR